MAAIKGKTRLSACVILTSMALTTLSVYADGYRATIISKEAILRREKTVASLEVDKLPLGTTVTVLETVDNWHRVSLSNKDEEGWILENDAMIISGQNRLKKGEVIANTLNIRLAPSTDHAIISSLNYGDQVTIINQQGEWYETILNNGMRGWVHSEFIKIVPNFPRAMISEDSVAVRSTPEEAGQILEIVNKSDMIYIKDLKGSWYHIITSSNQEGWIESKYGLILPSDVGTVNRSGDRRSAFGNIQSIAEKYLGKKYVYGGSGPNSFDCSGFTYYILNNYYRDYLRERGIKIPRTASEQAKVGITVARNELQPGDLVFFNTDRNMGKNITHVGFYIGNGSFIHASSSRANVIISSLSEGYYNQRFITATRL